KEIAIDVAAIGFSSATWTLGRIGRVRIIDLSDGGLPVVAVCGTSEMRVALGRVHLAAAVPGENKRQAIFFADESGAVVEDVARARDPDGVGPGVAIEARDVFEPDRPDADAPVHARLAAEGEPDVACRIGRHAREAGREVPAR